MKWSGGKTAQKRVRTLYTSPDQRPKMALQPISTYRLYQQVADQICELISNQEFPVGYRLPPERDVAKMLGVSRAVVREAMVALEIAGLVCLRKQPVRDRGAFLLRGRQSRRCRARRGLCHARDFGGWQ